MALRFFYLQVQVLQDRIIMSNHLSYKSGVITPKLKFISVMSVILLVEKNYWEKIAKYNGFLLDGLKQKAKLQKALQIKLLSKRKSAW